MEYRKLDREGKGRGDGRTRKEERGEDIILILRYNDNAFRLFKVDRIGSISASVSCDNNFGGNVEREKTITVNIDSKSNGSSSLTRLAERLTGR